MYTRNCHLSYFCYLSQVSSLRVFPTMRLVKQKLCLVNQGWPPWNRPAAPLLPGWRYHQILLEINLQNKLKTKKKYYETIISLYRFWISQTFLKHIVQFTVVKKKKEKENKVFLFWLINDKPLRIKRAHCFESFQREPINKFLDHWDKTLA